MDGGLTFCCPLTEKLEYIHRSYITAPVSPRDGITHIYSPINQTRLRTCFFLEYADVTQTFSPSPRKASASLSAILVKFVQQTDRGDRSTRGNKASEVTGGGD